MFIGHAFIIEKDIILLSTLWCTECLFLQQLLIISQFLRYENMLDYILKLVVDIPYQII